MTPIQTAFKEYRKKLGKAPEDPNWVPDVNSVTFQHFQAGWEAKPYQHYQECKVDRSSLSVVNEEEGDLL